MGFDQGGITPWTVGFEESSSRQIEVIKQHCWQDCSAPRGDAIVSIDADLQDDVAAIEPMLDAYRAGKDVVYGVRGSRSTDSGSKRNTAGLHDKILTALGVRIVYNHADFRLLSRRALEALKQYPEVNLFIRGIVPLIGFPVGNGVLRPRGAACRCQ